MPDKVQLPLASRCASDAAAATKAPVSICAVRAIKTPLGLSKNTCPFACNDPYISERLLPVTRFTATDEASGCLKTTEFPAPMEKLVQRKPSTCVFWVICKPAPPLVTAIDPEPVFTVPPVGRILPAIAGFTKAVVLITIRPRPALSDNPVTPALTPALA